jgi:tetratricopeptide (TPR) repeat protein
LARTLILSSYARIAAGNAREAEADARRAISIVEPVLAKRPADQTARLALADAYVALGDAAKRANASEAARVAWNRAIAVADSASRATGVAELRVLDAMALASAGRVADARPIARTLDAQGYRRPRWVARMRADGVVMQP